MRLFAGVTLGNGPSIVDTASGNDVPVDVGQTGVSIDAMAFDPSGSTLAVLTRAGVALWDVASHRLKAPILTGIPGAYRPGSGSVSVENGASVAAAVGERGVAIWNLNAQPALVQRLVPSGINLDGVPNVLRGATSAVFSPDGHLLAWTAAVPDDQLFVVVWDLERGRERTRLPGEQVISFSPDGNRIATKAFDNSDNSDNTVEVTNLDSGQRERHTAVPWTTPSAAAPDDGTPPGTPWQVHNERGLGASIPTDGALALWDTQRAQQIGKIDIGVEPDAATLAFDAQGSRLAVTESSGLAYVIDVDPDSWRTQACNLAARQLTESEKAAYLGTVEIPDGCP
ncbi:MAG TPA: hypothetical protein VGM60_23920 [Pseudonocardia sp.]|uniref:WD40 repeat domain-containing protein n=1 Tax=Pseudonocardia sp. TaxID=60912 RepID=UPI002F4140B8